MDETTWNTCTDPQRMLEYLRGRVSERKIRLFACACCRHIGDILQDRWSRLAIAAAVVLAFVGGYLAGTERDVATSFDTVWVTSATGSEAAAELLATHRAPDPSALFASMFAN